MSERRYRKPPATAWSARPGTETCRVPDEPVERRSDPRHVTLEFRAWLGWRIDGKQLCKIGVRLTDISRGGACAEAAEAVPRDRPILLMLLGLDMTQGSVWTRVVSSRRKARGTVVLHLSFEEPCPDALYGVARDGLRHAIRPGA
jgi:hypothetical protein